MKVKKCKVIGITNREKFNFVHVTYPTNLGFGCCSVYSALNDPMPKINDEVLVSVDQKYPSFVTLD